ncbi:MAG: efflux RND transporter periplasmic adaptor subunit, partial [Paraglaciecola chathamensis]
MVNRKLRWVLGTALFSLAVAVGLSGCDSVNSQEMAEQNADKVIKPVKLIKMPDLNQQQVNSFIAKLDATERAVLSFNVSGEIASAMPHMGQQIK